MKYRFDKDDCISDGELVHSIDRDPNSYMWQTDCRYWDDMQYSSSHANARRLLRTTPPVTCWRCVVNR